ncbi:hypothetical protein [Mycobacterium sp. 94-17]|uniref:hypothetical protein n=1 Tax=Mycobacterium sp. 94-17 TaxID=2986147 RepID=UPI002D1F2E41|nr:hypothetical protein [Mycobacterium sp. 94-17]MEB4208932.1 hypothetical protein [Mycobacterium sp. 94-17]
MAFRACARGLLVCAATAVAVAIGAGVAHASPNVDPRPQPPGVDQVEVFNPFPRTWSNPSNMGQPSDDSGEVGMICQNLLVRCQ